MAGTRWASALLLVVPLCGGCMTEVVLDAIGDTNAPPSRTITVAPVQILKASRTVDGAYRLMVRYSDGSTRALAFDPVPREGPDQPPGDDWPEVRAARELQTIPLDSSLPAGPSIRCHTRFRACRLGPSGSTN